MVEGPERIRRREQGRPPPRIEASARGIDRLAHPRVVGSIIGAVGGVAFVAVNRAQLPADLRAPAVLVCAAALASWVWSVLIMRRALGWIEPAPGAMRTYVVSVASMLLGLALGSRALQAAGRVELQVALVVGLVGLHFMPFARAFANPSFRWIGMALAGLGASGLGLGWFFDEHFAAAAAVLAGHTLIVTTAADAWIDNSK